MTPPKARRIQPPAPQLDADADYADAFEILIGENDSRTAEQAFRDGLGAEPGAGGRLVLWTHRHVLRFRLGPFTSFIARTERLTFSLPPRGSGKLKLE